jgi:hypothetical protein
MELIPGKFHSNKVGASFLFYLQNNGTGNTSVVDRYTPFAFGHEKWDQGPQYPSTLLNEKLLSCLLLIQTSKNCIDS